MAISLGQMETLSQVEFPFRMAFFVPFELQLARDLAHLWRAVKREKRENCSCLVINLRGRRLENSPSPLSEDTEIEKKPPTNFSEI